MERLMLSKLAKLLNMHVTNFDNQIQGEYSKRPGDP